MAHPSTDRTAPLTAERPETIRSAGLRWLLTLAAIVLWLYALIGPEGLRTQFDRRARRDALAQQLAEEQRRSEALRTEVEALREDDAAIERAIRDQLDYQRPGEKVLLVPPEPATTLDPSAPPQAAPH